MAGTDPVVTFLDAQRSYHDAERKLISLPDQRDQAILQIIEQGGMFPIQIGTTVSPSDRN